MVNTVFPVVLVVLSFVIDGGGAMRLEPHRLAVLRGAEARLTCSTSESWEAMVWLLNGTTLLTVSARHGALSSGDPNITALDLSTAAPPRSRWALVLRAAQRHHQGRVTCDLQNRRQRSASLSVQERGGVSIAGGNRTALQGQTVRFECTAAGWDPTPWVGWRVNGVEGPSGELNASRRASAGGGAKAGGGVTVISRLDITAAESSEVECLASVPAMTTPSGSSVRLIVVVEVLPGQAGGPSLLTAVAVLASLLLVLLLSAGVAAIVLYCRRRRRTESHGRDAKRFSQSGGSGSSVAEAAAAGRVNLGYRTEGLPDDATEGTWAQTSAVNNLKVPDPLPRGQNPPGAHVDPSKTGSKNIRMSTTV